MKNKDITAFGPYVLLGVVILVAICGLLVTFGAGADLSGKAVDYNACVKHAFFWCDALGLDVETEAYYEEWVEAYESCIFRERAEEFESQYKIA